MEKHKDKALEKDCLCSKCIFRFQCFTQERVFSDPIFQGLFEALMAQGKSREEALDEVTTEMKLKLSGPIIPLTPSSDGIYVDPCPNTTPDTVPSWEINWGSVSDNVSFDNVNGEVLVSYTMHDGSEVNWKV